MRIMQKMNIDSPNLLGGKGEPRNQGQPKLELVSQVSHMVLLLVQMEAMLNSLFPNPLSPQLQSSLSTTRHTGGVSLINTSAS